MCSIALLYSLHNTRCHSLAAQASGFGTPLAAPSAWSSNGTSGKYFCINISCGYNAEGVAQNLEFELE